MRHQCSYFLIVLLGAILIVPSTAALTQVFSGNVFSGEHVQVDDRFTFRVTLDKDRDQLFVDGGNMYASVPLNQCKELREGAFRVCFNATDFDNDKLRYFATIRVFQKKPTITVSRTITATKLRVGEEKIITTTITASGDDAHNVTLIDNFPDAIKVEEVDGNCYKYENSVYARYNNIDADSSKICRYTIKGKREFHGSLQAKVAYYDGYETKEVYSGKLNLDILPVLGVQTAQIVEDFRTGTYTPKNESIAVKLFFDDIDFDEDAKNPGVLIGEDVRFAVNVTNYLDKRLKIKGIDIHIPESLQFLGTVNVRRELINSTGNRTTISVPSDVISKVSPSLLRWSGALDPNVSKQFFLKFATKRSGFQELVATADYVYDDENYTEIKHAPFSVGDPGVRIKMDLIDKSDIHAIPSFTFTEDEDTRDVEALSTQRVRINVYNLNPYSLLRNVRVSTNTTLFTVQPATIKVLGLQQNMFSHDFQILFPRVNISQTYKVNLTASYKNQFGEEYQNSTEFEITVKPFVDLTVSHDSSAGFALDGGEETDFTVTVDNKRITDVRNIEVHDVLDSKLFVSGPTSKKLKLNRETKTKVYTYRIMPLRVQEKTYYNITTYLTYFDPAGLFTYQTNLTSTLTVYPKQPELTITKDISKDEVTVGQIIDIDYAITNNDKEEEVRDVIVHFPLQYDIDTIGDSKQYIKRIGPGETRTLYDVERIRPKVANDTIIINKTIVEYSDAYGNIFYKNTTEETIDVTAAEIIGPALFIEKKVPPQLTISQQALVQIIVRNIGTEEAQAQVEDNDRAWSVDVPGKSIRLIEYPISFNSEGAYVLSAPLAHYKNQGLLLTTSGNPVTVTVSQYVPVLVPVPSSTDSEKEEAVQTPEVATLEELLTRKQKIAGFQFKRQYILIGVLIFITIAIIVAYILYTKGETKKPFFLE